MIVANSNNCSNCSTHECVNRQRTFFSPKPYLCASLTTNSSRRREREREGVMVNFNFSITLTFYSLDLYYDLPSQ